MIDYHTTSFDIQSLSRKAKSRLRNAWFRSDRVKAKDEDIALLRQAGWVVEGVTERFLIEFWGTNIPVTNNPDRHVHIYVDQDHILTAYEDFVREGYRDVIGPCGLIGLTMDAEMLFTMGPDGIIYGYYDSAWVPGIKFLSPFVKKKYPICKHGKTIPVYRLGRDLAECFDNLCRRKYCHELIGMLPWPYTNSET